MAANSNTGSHHEAPSSLFDAVAHEDYNSMVLLYAHTTRNALISYLSIKQRWNSLAIRQHGRTSEAAEEKLDEYSEYVTSRSRNELQRLPPRLRSIQEMREQEEQPPASSSPFINPLSHFLEPPTRHVDDTTKPTTCHDNDGSSASSILSDSDDLSLSDSTTAVHRMIRELESIMARPHDNQADQEESGNDGKQQQERDVNKESKEDDTCTGHNQDNHPCKRTRKLEPAAVRQKNVGGGRKMTCSHPISNEAELIAWEASEVLSNARPSPDFVVTDTRGKRDEHVDAVSQDAAAAPPIFDGSVANSTPPFNANGAGGAAGGTGTILHLACAVDSPFSLAILLTMGADASASHTAFRRLMIHEAACCGSVECLSVLLEFGRRFAHELEQEEEQARLNNDERAVTSSESVASTDVGWFSASQLGFSNASNSTPDTATNKREELDSRAHHPFQMTLDEQKRLPLTQEMTGPRCFCEKLNFVLDISRKIKSNDLSPLEAARMVLSQIEVPRRTKSSLARLCCFERPREPLVASPPAIQRSFACTDGHGNSPLHWASFKNATTCVSLLLMYNANPNAQAQPSGWTPLHDAAYSDAAESIELLLNAGANIDAKANSGATPLCFAAQEDAPNATRLLVERGANPSVQCCGLPHETVAAGTTHAAHNENGNGENGNNGGGTTRFSGYTPLHYCAHYNAHNAARVLLQHSVASASLEIPDFSERLPIHVAVARGSSDVLRELLRGGARVDTQYSTNSTAITPTRAARSATVVVPGRSVSPVLAVTAGNTSSTALDSPSTAAVVTPVSSPVLRSMIPSRPISSTKPWNCLTQRSIDECRLLISESEGNWSPHRHSLFTPQDRRAVLELLRIGKRLEQSGTGIFVDLWPLVLSFCGRGWFVVPYRIEEPKTPEGVVSKREVEENSPGVESDEEEITQFLLDG